MLSLVTKMIQFSEGGYADIGLVSQMAFGVIGVVMGFYLVGWAYHWGDKTREWVEYVKRSVKQGSLAIPFAILGLVLAVVGILVGYDLAQAYQETLLPHDRSAAISIIIFVSGAVWFFVFGVFAYESGKAVNAFLQTGKIRWSFIVMMVSVLATGFIVQGATDALGLFVGDSEYDLVIVVAEMVTGILIAIFSSVLNASLRSEAKAKTKGAAQGA